MEIMNKQGRILRLFEFRKKAKLFIIEMSVK